MHEDTATYGWILVGKLVLVCGLLSLAALNKLRLTPALSRHDAAAAVVSSPDDCR